MLERERERKGERKTVKRDGCKMEMERNVAASRVRLAVGRKPKRRKGRMAGQ